MDYQTEQEKFWAGSFGNDYNKRESGQDRLAWKTYLFASILAKTHGVNSVIEFGANIGLNLAAICRLLPTSELNAIEINSEAVIELKKLDLTSVHEMSILEYAKEKQYDFVFSMGVLIHINPEKLDDLYQRMYDASCKYLCVIEYYNPSPVSINYRGNEERLFKRDFAGEIMDKFQNLKIVDYGFAYHRDNNFPLDDFNWFLMKKNQQL